MGSMYNTRVRERREATPWAVMSLPSFMRDMAVSGNAPASITCQYRLDVATRLWWTITWTDERGRAHTASAQELDLCLWRAAEMELQARNRLDEGEEVK